METPAARFGASEADWRNWRWQLRHALGGAEALAVVADLTAAERRGLALASEQGVRVAVTPYYASLIDRAHPSCPVRIQAIPTAAEFERSPGDLQDPLGEDVRRPARALVHRYPDRALLLATDRCAVYCRHCTRRRVTLAGEGALSREDLDRSVEYLRTQPAIRDVIISGGDPLVLDDDRLDALLSAVRSVPHVKVVRLATRAPVVLPMRIDVRLAALLRRHAPLFVVTHFNHPKECTDDARAACEALVDAGVPVENQTVLLRGVNSSARILRDLFETLLGWRVRPYYLHQGDLAAGTGHLRTPLEAGVAILEALRGTTSGLAIPHLAVDLPGGGGKVTLLPDYRLPAAAAAERGTWLRNGRGERYFYPEPPERDCTCPYEAVYYRTPEEPGAGGPAAAGPGRDEVGA